MLYLRKNLIQITHKPKSTALSLPHRPYRCCHFFHAAHVAGVFLDVDGSAHGNLAVTEFHATFNGDSAREVELAGPGDPGYLGDIARIDAASGHNDKPLVRLLT